MVAAATRSPPAPPAGTARSSSTLAASGAETSPRSTAPVPDFHRPPTWVSAEVTRPPPIRSETRAGLAVALPFVVVVVPRIAEHHAPASVATHLRPRREAEVNRAGAAGPDPGRQRLT